MGKIFRPLPEGIFYHAGRGLRHTVNAAKATHRAAKKAAEHARRAHAATVKAARAASAKARRMHKAAVKGKHDFLRGFRGA